MNRQHRMVRLTLVLVTLVSAGLAGSATASASGTGPGAGSGPDDALLPDGEWDQLRLGESHWYAFHYQGDGSQVQVRLQVEPHDSATFVVWTPDQIWHWGLGEYVEPVGRGSDDPRAEGILVWSGSFPNSGTYYVVVEHAGGHAGTSYYLLDVSGEGVSLSKPSPTPTPSLAENQIGSRTQAKSPGEPTGRLVFQTTFGGTFYAINVDGSGLQSITHGIDPVWSPDGQQIAFVRWEEPRGVWVVDSDGSNAMRVFEWPRETRVPSWSPDGEQIVFMRQHRGRIGEIERCVARGEKVFCFTLPPNPHYNLGVVRVDDGSFWEPLPSSTERSLTPDWSPSGDQIAYADVYGIFIQSADGQDRYQLTYNNKDISPAWSPDGQRVAFVRRQHDHWEIYVVDADGRNLRRLTTTPARSDGVPANSVSPAWSPDGNYIAFLTDRTGAWEIWVMRADGANASGGPKPLFDTELDGLTLEYAFHDERALSWTQ
ncbi:DPP IV N-terminal domain-containing protein [Chloroflexota bacterium]